MKITTDSSIDLQIGEYVRLSINGETICGEVVSINIKARIDSSDNVFEYEIDVSERY